jgi:hypothetical protein
VIQWKTNRASVNVYRAGVAEIYGFKPGFGSHGTTSVRREHREICVFCRPDGKQFHKIGGCPCFSLFISPLFVLSHYNG